MSVQSTPSRPAGRTSGDKVVRYHDYIDAKIQSTRRTVKLIDLATALVGLIVGVLLFLLVVTAAEHWAVRGGLSTSARWVLFAGLASYVVYFAYRRLWPLCVRAINPVYAAQAIEQASPTLKNSLINLLLFREHRAEISDAVYRTLEEQAAHGLTRVPADAAVDQSHLIRLGYVLLVVVAAAGLYKVLSPKDPLVTAERVLMPWANIVPASRVTIAEVTPGTVTISRGEYVDVSADVRGLRDDDTVALRYTTDDGQVAGRAVPMKAGSDGRTFSCRLEDKSDSSGTGGISRTLVYWLEAGDARSLNYQITVVPAATILVERVDYDYPAYTGFVDRSVDGVGDIRAIEGTRITVHARANGGIREANVDFEADGQRDLRMTAAEGNAHATFQLDLREDRQTPRHASYVLRFMNDEGRANIAPVKHSIAVERDIDPEATIRLPQEKAIDARADEDVAIEVEAHDPDFALSAVRLRGEVAGKSVLDEKLLTAEHRGQFSGRYVLRPDAHGLKGGDVVEYWVEADDNRAPKPNTAVSERRVVRVVSPNPAQQPPANQVAQNDRQPKQPDERQGEGEKGRGGEAGGKAGEQGQQGEKNQQLDRNAQPNKEQGNQEKGEQGEKQGDDQPKNDQQQNDQQQNDPQRGDKQQGDQSQGGSQSKQQQGQQDDKQQQDKKGGQGAQSQGSSEGGKSKSHDLKQQPQEGGQKGGESDPNGEQGQGGKQSQDGSGQNGKSGQEKRRGDGETGRAGDKQVQGGAKDQDKAPVSSEGDNDAEAFNRIQRHMQEKGELKREEERRGEGKKGRQGEEQGQPGDKDQGAAKEQGAPKEQGTAKDQGAAKDQSTGQDAQQSADKGAQQEKDGSKQGNKEGAKQGEQKPGQQGQASGQDQQQQGAKSPDEKGSGGAETRGDDVNQKPEKPGERGEKPGDEKAPGGEQTSSKGSAGDGKNQDSQGSPNSKPGMQPKEKPEQAGSKEKQKGGSEPPAGANSKKESDSHGDEGGDKAGGGGEGGGQKSPHDGTGSSGSNQSADNGGGQSGEKGKGENSASGGQDAKSKERTGSNDGKTKGEGSGRRDGSGDKPGGTEGRQGEGEKGRWGDEKGEGGAKDQGAAKGENKSQDQSSDRGAQQGAKQENGEQSKQGQEKGQPGDKGQQKQGDKETGKQADQQGEQQPGGKPGDGKQNDNQEQNNDNTDQGGASGGNGQPGGAVNPQPSITGEAPPGDAANLEYARKQTDLVLGKLAEQMKEKKVDDKLLKDLGWSQADLKRFVDRWQQLKENAARKDETADTAKRDLDDALRSLGLRPGELRQSTAPKDSMRDLHEGYHGPVPAEYKDRLRAYNQGVSRAHQKSE